MLLQHHGVKPLLSNRNCVSCCGCNLHIGQVLRDAVTLEAQLAEARSSNARLQSEVEKLNDTVFSKTFRAPSAWAEREVKYKMEKKDWDTQVDPPANRLLMLTAKVGSQYESSIAANALTLGPGVQSWSHVWDSMLKVHNTHPTKRIVFSHVSQHVSMTCVFLQVERLQGVITKLKAENVEYRDNNKTQQFEASIQELQQKLQQTGTRRYSV